MRRPRLPDYRDRTTQREECRPDVQDNGLPAEGFTAVADVSASVAVVVLGALRAAGIAAYVVPTGAGAARDSVGGPAGSAAASGAPPALEGEGRTDRPAAADPRTPLRLWVDAAATEDARAVLRRLSGGGSAPTAPAAAPVVAAGTSPGPRDGAADGGVDDEAWAQIVAAFHASPDGDLEAPGRPPGWPPRPGRVLRARAPEPGAREDATSPDGGADPEPEPWLPSEPTRAEPRTALDGDEAQEHFVPPPPPPLPRGDTVSRLAWAGVLGGPGLLVLALLLGRDVPTWAGATAVVAFVAGFATLVVRLGGEDERDDDGAVV